MSMLLGAPLGDQIPALFPEKQLTDDAAVSPQPGAGFDAPNETFPGHLAAREPQLDKTDYPSSPFPNLPDAGAALSELKTRYAPPGTNDIHAAVAETGVPTDSGAGGPATDSGNSNNY